MKRDIVLIDIDGVIAHADWRLPFINTEGWDKFFEEARNDHPIVEMVTLVNCLATFGLNPVGVTTRPQKFSSMTVKWLFEKGVKLVDIMFRPDNDFRPAAELKLLMIERIQSRVLFAIDDDDKVCEAYRSAGITVLQCFAAKEILGEQP